MANLPESPASFPAGVYQIETTDPVVGGPPNEGTGAGMSNIPHKQLADRTAFLKASLDALSGIAFTSANSPRLLGQNGHFRLGTGGLLIQWGNASINVGPTAIFFPITFPTAIFGVLLTDMLGELDPLNAHVVSVVDPPTRFGFQGVAVAHHTNAYIGTGAFYVALGH